MYLLFSYYYVLLKRCSGQKYIFFFFLLLDNISDITNLENNFYHETTDLNQWYHP